MPSFPYWFSESYSVDGLTSTWAPVTQTDNQRLEKALSAKDKITYIESRRFSADIVAREMRSCYDFPSSSCSTEPLPPRRIMRAGWLYVDSSGGSPVPMSEEVSQEIENWFNTIKDNEPSADASYTAEMNVDLVLNNERKGETVTYRVFAEKERERERKGTSGKRLAASEVVLSTADKQKVNGFSIKMYPKSTYLLKLGALTLLRGLPEAPSRAVDEAWGELEDDHLVLVVHGIGQFYFAGTDDSFDRCISAMRKNVMEQRCELDVEDAASAKASAEGGSGKVTAGKTAWDEMHGKSNPNNHRRIECLGVDWFNEIHDDSKVGMNDALAKVTLPSIPSIRKLAHDVAMDVMLYLTPEFRDRIVRVVVEKINLIYLQFCELNPSFVKNGGKCTIVGHSLGTVIIYDVLSAQGRADLPDHLRLSFEPTAYFALGSPLGLFLSVRNCAGKVCHVETSLTSKGDVMSAEHGDDMLGAASYEFPTCKQFFNMFNKNDPVAYRLEPLADEVLQQKEPMIVPHHAGGLRTQYLLKSVASSITETFKSFTATGWFSSATATSASSVSTSLTSTTAEADRSSLQSTRLSLSDKELDEDASLPLLLRLQKQAAHQRRRKICPLNEIPHVHINGGRRFDYLLQESMIEGANEYLSSLSSHTSYFDQKDVARFIAAMLI